MRLPDNIERAAFGHGKYVGYSGCTDDYIFRIVPILDNGRKVWLATARISGWQFESRTLAELSEKLKNYKGVKK